MSKTLIILGTLLVAIFLILGACTPAAAPAEFEVISLDVAPSEVAIGETVSVTVVVENVGGSEGTYAAVLTVDGVTIEAQEVTIAQGSSKVVTFSLLEDALGTYEIGVGELSSTLIVKEAAKIEITFNPNPVPCEDGYWLWRVILTEVNGIGVTLSSVSMDIYADGMIDKLYYDSDWIGTWLDSAYLSAHTSENFGAGFPCQEITYEIVTVTGIDDKGNEITATGRIDFLQPD